MLKCKKVETLCHNIFWINYMKLCNFIIPVVIHERKKIAVLWFNKFIYLFIYLILNAKSMKHH